MIKNEFKNCNINNIQIGNHNIMKNYEILNEWDDLDNFFKDLEVNNPKNEYITKTRELIKNKDKNGLKDFILKNYNNFFCDILSNITSSTIMASIKSLIGM